MKRTILVTGATGKVGGELVRLLLRSGESVRSATRTPAALSSGPRPLSETVEFDFSRQETFAPALRGIDRVFLIARPGDNHSDEAAMPFIDTAAKEGVRLIVNLTAMGVETDDTFMLRVLEKYVEDSGIPFVHLRPNWFMQNFNSGPMAADIRNTGALHLPAADAKISFIDVRDIAATAMAALIEPRHAGNAYTLTGGRALDHSEAVSILSGAAGRTIHYAPLTEEAAAAALTRAGVAAGLVERWTGFYRKVRQGLCSTVTPDVESVTGRPPVTFEEYARDYASSWK